MNMIKDKDNTVSTIKGDNAPAPAPTSATTSASAPPVKRGRGRPKGSKTKPLYDEAGNIVKRKRNRPDLQNYGAEFAQPGDNTRFLRYARVSMSLPPIDISDPKQVERRINEYFDFCEANDRKPNMVGMGNWLGVSRDTINQWKRGDMRSATHSDLIRKAVQILEDLWVDYMQNGKVNPASGIFLGKNMFQYKDTQDVVFTPQNNVEDDLSAEDITRRYLDDGKAVETDFSDAGRPE